MAFGCLITESKLRRREDPVWEETGQGSCVTDSCCCQPYLWPQANPRGPRKSSYLSGGKTNKEQHYKCKLTGHWAWIARKSPPDHAQLSNKEFIGRETALSPVGEGGSCSWDGHAGWLRLPGNSGGSPIEMSIFIQESHIVLDMIGTRLIFNWYRATNSVLISQAFLQKLYCDWYQWKASYLLLYWAFHLPVWTVVDFTCLFINSCAWLYYLPSRKRPSGLPWVHTMVKRPQTTLYLDSDQDSLAIRARSYSQPYSTSLEPLNMW